MHVEKKKGNLVRNEYFFLLYLLERFSDILISRYLLCLIWSRLLHLRSFPFFLSIQRRNSREQKKKEGQTERENHLYNNLHDVSLE